MPGVLVASGTLGLIADKLRQIPKRSNSGPALENPASQAFWVKLTGFSAGVYQWTAQRPDAGTPGTFVALVNPAITGSYAHEANGSTTIATGRVVRLRPLIQDGAGHLHYVFVAEPGLKAPVNPLDLTYAGEHADAAGGDVDGAFDLTTLGVGDDTHDGLKRTIVIGTAYHEAGDQKLYEYRRDEIYDLQGRLVSGSAVYRVEIDVPEDCS